ncbi:hypothetical protein C0Q70_09673 [Pomacea canaliculata]|uniref:Uncharacterized protein n=1 Tax=Pomacea canaliculata TaxID=400727 RepID=A0A2T7PAG2_POMCA|nr:hypothetical protein C0Q70_09673 [Pomacea canaliculata]
MFLQLDSGEKTQDLIHKEAGGWMGGVRGLNKGEMKAKTARHSLALATPRVAGSFLPALSHSVSEHWVVFGKSLGGLRSKH